MADDDALFRPRLLYKSSKGGRRLLRLIMKIVVLSYADVANIIGTTLLDRGHESTWFGGGDVHQALLQSLSDHDGCLLLGDEPELEALARQLRDQGKMIWREWTDVPPTKEWPKGGKLATLDKP